MWISDFGMGDTMPIRWENRLSGLGVWETDFFSILTWILNLNKKKIRLHPPNPLNPFSHRIGIVSPIPKSEIPNPKSPILNPKSKIK
jgi:hypothetical protein